MLRNSRLSLVRLLVEQAPPTPACFDSDLQYHEYLLLSHHSGERVVRREDIGKHRHKAGNGQRVVRTVFAIEPFQHCLDCPIGGAFQRRMVRDGRCELVAKGIAIDDVRNAAAKRQKARHGPQVAHK
jgi:hypothetical protein